MGSKKPELVSLAVSAWSLKARFALKHHGIKYTTTPYTPVIGEWWLRLRLGKFSGKVTVPVLFTQEGRAIPESYEIAKWANAHSERPGAERLFPQGMEPQIRRWNEASDKVLGFARIALTEQLLANPAAMRRTVPPNFRMLGPVGVFLTHLVVSRLSRKYKQEGQTPLQEVLALLREAQDTLRRSGTKHLVGEQLTYADMAMAVAVQVVKPLGTPFSTTFREPLAQFEPLQGEFAELVAWRDALFEKHFPLDGAQAGPARKSKDS